MPCPPEPPFSVRPPFKPPPFPLHPQETPSALRVQPGRRRLPPRRHSRLATSGRPIGETRTARMPLRLQLRQILSRVNLLHQLHDVKVMLIGTPSNASQLNTSPWPTGNSPLTVGGSASGQQRPPSSTDWPSSTNSGGKDGFDAFGSGGQDPFSTSHLQSGE